jgi:hypothetical protein
LIPLDRETAKLIAEDIEIEYAEEQADFAGTKSPPSCTEATECRRIKFFSANLGVFGVYRWKIFSTRIYFIALFYRHENGKLFNVSFWKNPFSIQA